MKNILVKVLALSLSIIICLPVLNVVSFADEVDFNDIERNQSAYKVLDAIGIVGEDDESKLITRAEASKYFASFMSYDSTSWGGILGYYDVLPDNKYYNSIGICRDLKIMSGKSDVMFDPYSNITVQEAVTCIIRILGYDLFAKNSGGFPGGYVREANSLGILDGIDYNLLTQPLTTNILVTLMYNSLDVNVMENNTISSDGSYELVEGDEYILSDLHMIKTEGILNSIGPMTMYDGAEVIVGKINVSGVILESNINVSADLLGNKVEYYYKQSPKNTVDGTLVYIHKSDDTNVLTLSKEDLIIDGDTLKYDDGKTIRKISVSKNAKYIYNNRQALAFDLSNLNNYLEGKISFISNDGDLSYDVISVEEYQNIFVMAIDKNNGIIYDKYDPDLVLEIDISEVDSSVFITDNNANKVEFADISVEDVISYTISKDKNLTNIIVNKKRTPGLVTEMKKVGTSIKTISLGDQAFELAANIKPYMTDIDIGKSTITVVFDKQGKIAGHTVNISSLFEYAYLINLRTLNDLSDDLYIKTFVAGSEKNQFSSFKLGKKVVVDGTSYKLNDQVERVALENYLTDLLESPILIKKDADLIVTDIKTTKSDDILLAGNMDVYYGSIGGQKLYLTSNCMVIAISNEGDYTSYPATSLTRENTYTGKGYKQGEDEIAADLVILKSDGEISGLEINSPTLVVSEVSKGVDDEGEPVEIIRGYDGTTYCTYKKEIGKEKTLSGEYVNIKEGDMLRYEVDANGVFIDIQVLASAKDNVIYSSSNPSNSNVYAKPRVFKGYVYKKTLSHVIFTYASPDTLEILPETKDPDAENFEVRSLSNPDIYVYDSSLREGQRLYKGTIDDLYTYKDFETNCSKIIANTRGTYLEACIVIK